MVDHPLRIAALAILNSGVRLTRRAGSFAGECVADPRPLTEKQAHWFSQLAEQAGVEWEGSEHG
ncbi:hypothetical protein [Erythrobacter sp. HI0063]|uniref:hypothetical protein n=1 Tax=Erythrobacter sp. HI0063 TaxID=1822240 RepID=UPI0018D35784|nr:hypothetical protein [Erythrobacter sp. HI0063]